MINSQQKNIEIEFRAIFGEKDFCRLKEYLDKNAKNLGEDDKDVFFFIMPDKLLKVVDNISKNNAKLVLKLKRKTKRKNMLCYKYKLNLIIIFKDYDKHKRVLQKNQKTEY